MNFVHTAVSQRKVLGGLQLFLLAEKNGSHPKDHYPRGLHRCHFLEYICFSSGLPEDHLDSRTSPTQTLKKKKMNKGSRKGRTQVARSKQPFLAFASAWQNKIVLVIGFSSLFFLSLSLSAVQRVLTQQGNEKGAHRCSEPPTTY